MRFKRVILYTLSFKQLLQSLGPASMHKASLKAKEKRAMREKEREAPKAKEGSTICHKFLLSLQSGQGVA